ncbi:hypothetical protein AAVH_31073, partial [Aphelenchoides avenae]
YTCRKTRFADQQICEKTEIFECTQYNELTYQDPDVQRQEINPCQSYHDYGARYCRRLLRGHSAFSKGGGVAAVCVARCHLRAAQE